jgi:hypothetical protein
VNVQVSEYVEEGSGTGPSLSNGMRTSFGYECYACTIKTCLQRGGVVTAGNSSQVSDAVAVVVMSAEKAASSGSKPLARGQLRRRRCSA